MTVSVSVTDSRDCDCGHDYACDCCACHFDSFARLESDRLWLAAASEMISESDSECDYDCDCDSHAADADAGRFVELAAATRTCGCGTKE